MHYYLRHPVHGTKVAISEMEVTLDSENGWEEYDPLDDVETPTSAKVSASENPPVENALKAPRRRRS
jgi:hypothetical protein